MTSLGSSALSLSFLQGQLLSQGGADLAPSQVDAPRSSPGGAFHIQDRLLVIACALLCSLKLILSLPATSQDSRGYYVMALVCSFHLSGLLGSCSGRSSHWVICPTLGTPTRRF